MKIFYVILCISAVIIHSYAGNPEASYEECLAEHGFKKDDLEKLKDDTDKRLHCIMACVMNKEGLIVDEKIDVEALKDSIVKDFAEVDKKTASMVVDTCMNIANGMDEMCDKANVLGICIKDQLDKMNIKLKKK